ncbi:hypothetical protein CF319_g1016 [Tilletia indica]|uniref:Uncharacterized protein n=1 Tax=Tilletia indica TaxID=43049 RepID=A0A8T8TE29_9BASI|nr:hypothetical protein CF319_g1016 [Tilletia indica]KAE8230324.1 hypothetical protein CF326_g4678 [Tilletia indica]KAE8258953.1 hypothetical protein A4X13_0g1339 [Tilletia indica]
MTSSPFYSTDYMDDVRINGPEPIDALTQVRSATIGLGNTHISSDLRGRNGQEWPLEDEETTPHLVKWLRGESTEHPTAEFDNKLVNIKTSAAFPCYQRCLVPAWARFNRILERTDDANRDVETSFASGEISTADFDL